MDILNKKLKASSLAETLVAMVIVMLSFGIATLVFSNVTRSSSLPQKIKAETMLKGIAIRSKQEKLFLDATFQSAGMEIRKKISPYAGSSRLSLMSLEARDASGREICSHNELVFVE